MGNQSLTPHARHVIEPIISFAMQTSVLAALRRAQAVAVSRLQREPTLHATFVAVDPTSLGVTVPPAIGTIRVAISRAGRDAALERHPNSTQVLLVLDGTIETHTETADGWRIDRYGDGSAAVLENRWHFVPQGMWHKSRAPGPGDCVLAVFHSAREVQDQYRE